MTKAEIYKKGYNLKIRMVIAALCTIVTGISCVSAINYARLKNKNEWSQHYGYGGPSWDSFERMANNPVYRGHEGMEWPVNGFLFDDPVSHNWYLYIGEYTRNYSTSASVKDRNCVVYKSSDKGKTWSKSGNLFPDGMICYDSIEMRIPDVMVTYAEGKYHLIFDWGSKHASWADMSMSGIGYAVGDKPEGPFTVSKTPLKISGQYKSKPLLGKKLWHSQYLS